MLNTKLQEKFSASYQNLRPSPIYFMEGSEEYWKPITQDHVPGVKEGAYEISTYGRVRSSIRNEDKSEDGTILSQSTNSKGYHQLNLVSDNLYTKSGNKAVCCVKIHRLEKIVFDFEPGCELLEIDHIDGNKDNNDIWNLDWVDPRENTIRGIEVVSKPVFGHSDSINRVLSDEEARNLCQDFLNNVGDPVDLSVKYGVSPRYVNNMLIGVGRPYLNEEYGTKEKFYNDGYHSKTVNTSVYKLSDEEAEKYL